MNDYGRKHICFKCGCRFYDLKKEVPLCPKCGTDQREKPEPAPRASVHVARKKAPLKEEEIPYDDLFSDMEEGADMLDEEIEEESENEEKSPTEDEEEEET